MRKICSKIARRALLALLALAATSAVAAAQPVLIHEELQIPAATNGSPATLSGLAIRPAPDVRYPLVLMTHGTSFEGVVNDRATPERLAPQADVFARRGYAVVIVLRRGFGASTGPRVELLQGPCASRNFMPATLASGNDLRDALVWLQTKPWVDTQNVVAVGQSTGGAAVLALAATGPRGLRAVVNFAGGRESRQQNVVCSADGMVDAFADLGRRTRIPTLWLYAANDRLFGPELAQRFYAAYTAGGGQAQFLALPAFGADGHSYFVRASADWSPRVFAFLRAQGLPG
jgi:dienelactone hydrolase